MNRVTSSGKGLGLEQRITPFEALRAVTAWQNFEEDRRGTLENMYFKLSEHPVK